MAIVEKSLVEAVLYTCITLVRGIQHFTSDVYHFIFMHSFHVTCILKRS